MWEEDSKLTCIRAWERMVRLRWSLRRWTSLRSRPDGSILATRTGALIGNNNNRPLQSASEDSFDSSPNIF